MNLDKFAKEIRIALLEELMASKGGHIGGSLSIVSVLAVLYGKQCKHNPIDPNWKDRDYVILSKGHAGPALYATLACRGYFDSHQLMTLNQGGTLLPSHPDRLKIKGVDMTTGSLGQGSSVAAGLAFDIHQVESHQYVYTILGDGELNEGQNWEAFSFIAHHNLHQCILFVDNNKKQLDGYTTEINCLQSLPDKFRSFGFNCIEVDGSSCHAIDCAIEVAKSKKDKPTCILLDTIKGSGIEYFENLYANHSVKFQDKENAIIRNEIVRLKEEVAGEVNV